MHEKVAAAFKAQDKFDEALKAYRDSLAIRERLAAANPSNAQWQRDLAYIHALIGILMEAKGDLQAAVASYSEAIRIAPTLASVWNSRCWAHAMRGQLEEALSDCNESLRLKPDDPATLDSRGLVLLKLGQYEKAIADYDDALKLDPKLAGSLYGRGLARLKLGDRRGEDDIKAARAMQADIVEEFTRYGVT
jgi:tetratricopeptide (TPR) repeat protein